jgi:TusA-related sulfurtransferase
MKPQHDHCLDLRSTIIPFALLDATEAFRQMKSGETMEVLVGDPETRMDLLKVLPTSLYELIEVRQERSFFRIFLKKKDIPIPSGLVPL